MFLFPLFELQVFPSTGPAYLSDFVHVTTTVFILILITLPQNNFHKNLVSVHFRFLSSLRTSNPISQPNKCLWNQPKRHWLLCYVYNTETLRSTQADSLIFIMAFGQWQDFERFITVKLRKSYDAFLLWAILHTLCKLYFLAKFLLPCKIIYSLFCVLFLVSKIVSKHPFTQGRIKGFVGPREFT
jgi:hypothetical protein